MGWIKKADPIAPVTTAPKPGLPGVGPKPPFPGAKPPMAPGATPPMPGMKPPMTEKQDVATADSVCKSLKMLIERESAEGEGKDVKLLQEALEKVEKFKGGEKKEVRKEDSGEKSEKKEPKEEKKDDKKDE